ncbi:hypothetical protein [Mycolicibacter longobardus]|uniref:Facilitated glucose transporter n=1 Tax=Mycolicibacter longobardus TaxID=1108812 RepID=A0A1X1YDL2_9MYCO|nr:hypothetical protein [Mycolicibacter longobardus]MCV7382507.1 hypothetical protein [Mycolicibacter longobardus]ORW09134.1 hypothetical protein AWC16_17280 [Mycolicibacter longobardus]
MTTDAPAFNFLVLALLTVDGVLCAVTTALLLPARIGEAPFPLSALIGGLVNLGLVWVALQCTSSLRLAALPLWAWLVAIALMTLGGPGDDLIFTDRGVMAYGVLLMILLGSAPPGWLLWRRRQALAARSPAGHP